SNRAWIALLGNEGSGSEHWLINSAGITQFGVWNGGQTNPTLPIGVWKHVATTFDGATLACYVDGVLVGSTTATFNLQGALLTLAQSHLNENYFNGSLDDVRIYNRALSAGEIAALVGPVTPLAPTIDGGFESPYAGPAGVWTSFVYSPMTGSP